jgi:serine/threonine-protein kinase
MPAGALSSAERQFGRYDLLYRLAAGGMARLFVARFEGMEGFEKLLAIKRIHSHLAEDREFVKMFFDEARLAARITHPNVVQVIELGQCQNDYFIAMEYVHGESLAHLLRVTHPPYPIGARIVADAAAGLHEAHELRDNHGEPLNVVHRDVSPQNILISYKGAVKVTDFGVARARDNIHITSGGTLKGKFGYMSPEQAMAQEVDRRSDVFSLGIVLYETTTRKRLFKGDGSVETLKKVTSGEIVPPTRLLKDYPPRLEQIVLTALERDPSLRYQTAQEMEHELERFIVSCGAPVLPSEISSLMTGVFGARIAEKQRLLRRAPVTVDPLDLAQSEASTLSLPGQTASKAERGRRARRLLVGGIALMLGVAGVLGAIYWTRGSGAIPAGGGREAAAGVVQAPIHIIAEPAAATIRVDGETVANPFMTPSRPGARGKLRVEISAAGYRPRTIEVQANEGGRYLVRLKPRAPDATPAAAAPASDVGHGASKKPGRRKRPRRKDPLDEDEGLYGNPFESR